MRTPADDCLICKTEKALHKNSHITPSGLLTSAIGKRYSEEAYTIDIEAATVKVHFGRDNLKNTNPTPTQNPHAMSYIFCLKCEHLLSQLESLVIPLLNEKIRKENYTQLFEKVKYNPHLSCYSTNSAQPESFFYFLASVVWRMCLKIKIEDGLDTIPEELYEQFQKALYAHLYGKSGAEDLLKSIRGFNVITAAPSQKTNNTNLINPYPQVLNPDIYLVNEIAILVHRTDMPATDKQEFREVTKLDPFLTSLNFANALKKPVKILFISLTAWEKFLMNVKEKGGKKAALNYASSLLRKR
jgi:hypothetical protein